MTEPIDHAPAPPARAADGNRMPPAANTFAEFVGFLEDGQLNVELSEVLRELSGDLRNAAIEGGGKSKGKLDVTFEFSLEGGIFTIASKHKVTLPPAKRPRSVMWATADNRFTPSNPMQGQLFGVREVGGDGGFRTA